MSNPPGLINVRGFRWYDNVISTNIEPAIVSAYEQGWPAHYVQPPAHSETHWYWVLDYFYTSGAKFRIGKHGHWMRRQPFVAHLYRPNSQYWHSMKGEKSVSRSIYLSIRGADPLHLERYLPEGQDFCAFADPDHYLGSRLQDLVSIGETEGTQGFLQGQVVLFQILATLEKARLRTNGRHTIQMTDAPKSPTTSLVASTQRFMERHLAEDITLGRLAKQANLSVSAFSQQFKAHTGQSPMHMLTRLRIQRAKELLLRGEPLRNIADATGFCDAYHLSRRFKQIEHMPPRMFVKRLNAVFSPPPTPGS